MNVNVAVCRFLNALFNVPLSSAADMATVCCVVYRSNSSPTPILRPPAFRPSSMVDRVSFTPAQNTEYKNLCEPVKEVNKWIINITDNN